jgi:putative spermidine/putrescine transport system substrate-binding protein
MGVLADSEQQELARKLIDFSMKPEVQTGFAKELYYGPTNTEVQLEGDLADKVVYGKEKVERLITPDWNEILANREEWLTKWTEATAQ